MNGWMYILECSDGSYYTGSTNNLELRLQQHQNGEGANHTKKHLPVKLVYYEEFQRIDQAFYREKQVQGWSRKKKEALINSDYNKLPKLAMAYRDLKATGASVADTVVSRASATIEDSRASTTIEDLRNSVTIEDSLPLVSVASGTSTTSENSLPLVSVVSRASTTSENSLPEVLEGNGKKHNTL